MGELPATVNLTCYHGDTWSQTFRILEESVPVDLTGATLASWAVQQGYCNGDGHSELQVTVDADPTTGVFVLALPAGGLDAGRYTYDVEVITPDTRVTTWIRGRLDVQGDITNG